MKIDWSAPYLASVKQSQKDWQGWNQLSCTDKIWACFRLLYVLPYNICDGSIRWELEDRVDSNPASNSTNTKTKEKAIEQFKGSEQLSQKTSLQEHTTAFSIENFKKKTDHEKKETIQTLNLSTLKEHLIELLASSTDIKNPSDFILNTITERWNALNHSQSLREYIQNISDPKKLAPLCTAPTPIWNYLKKIGISLHIPTSSYSHHIPNAAGYALLIAFKEQFDQNQSQHSLIVNTFISATTLYPEIFQSFPDFAHPLVNACLSKASADWIGINQETIKHIIHQAFTTCAPNHQSKSQDQENYRTILKTILSTTNDTVVNAFANRFPYLKNRDGAQPERPPGKYLMSKTPFDSLFADCVLTVDAFKTWDKALSAYYLSFDNTFLTDTTVHTYSNHETYDDHREFAHKLLSRYLHKTENFGESANIVEYFLGNIKLDPNKVKSYQHHPLTDPSYVEKFLSHIHKTCGSSTKTADTTSYICQILNLMKTYAPYDTTMKYVLEKFEDNGISHDMAQAQKVYQSLMDSNTTPENVKDALKNYFVS